MYSTAVARLGVAGVTLTLLMACSGDPSGAGTDREPVDKSPATSPKPKPSPSAKAEVAAVKAYRSMWADAVEAGKTSDPKHPRLNDHASGEALSLLQYTMKGLDDDDLVGKGKPSISPYPVSASKKKVELRDCLDSTRWLNYHEDGTLENDRPGGRYRTDATVKLSKKTWTVTRLYLHARGSC